MTEIYRNDSQNVYLDVYGAGADAPPSAVCTRPGDDVAHPLDVIEVDPAPDGVTQRYSVVLGLAETQNAGEVRVGWTFTIGGVPVFKEDIFDVVVPLVDLATIAEELEVPEDVTDAQLRRAERRVRIVIETITGEQFAPYLETNVATTVSGNTMRLPKRLLSPTKIGSLAPAPNTFTLSHEGWVLRSTQGYYPGMDVSSGVPINDPYHLNRFRVGSPVPITGVWGWDRVPREITEAALLLIEEQLCPETLYRERYLISMTAADWRIQFSPSAFVRTGNVIADQILGTFIHNNMAVI